MRSRRASVVRAGRRSAAAPPVSGAASVAPEASATEADGADAASSADQPVHDDQAKSDWRIWAGTGVIGVLVGVGLALFWSRRRRPQTARPPLSAERQPRLGSLRDALHQACAQNDADAAARALLAWAQALWPRQPPANLAAIAARISDDAGSGASEQIQALERRLYAPNAGSSAAPWDGNGRWRAL